MSELFSEKHGGLHSWRRLSFSAIPSVNHSIRAFGLFLLPSAIRDRYFPQTSSTQKRSPGHGRLSGLDGLRGVACLLVLNHHYCLSIKLDFQFPYESPNNHYFVMLPILRLVGSGDSMVKLFFVISGYVLSHKALTQMYHRDSSGVYTTITSSVIRRWMRLYIPTLIAVMLWGFFAWLGVYKPSQKVWDTRPDIHLFERPPPPQPTFNLQMWDVIGQMWRMISGAWYWDPNRGTTHYDSHLWTIPIEFRTSMVLFLVLIGVARLRKNFRTFAIAASCVFTILSGRNEMYMFLGGMFIADLDVRRLASAANREASSGILPHAEIPGSTPSQQRLREMKWIGCFIVGLYFLSISLFQPELQYGYMTLQAIAAYQPGMGPNELIKITGAIMIVAAVANSDCIRPLFTNPFSAYLGKISYALYIVHAFTLSRFAYVLLPHLWLMVGITDTDKALPAQIYFVWCGVLLIIPITLWVADIYWRAVDKPAVKFARWVESKVVNGPDDYMPVAGQGRNGIILM